MLSGDLAYVVMAINPIGGLLIAIPIAVFKLQYPAWILLLSGPPLAYVQVFAVDWGWSWLEKRAWWRSFLEKRRSARVEKLLASQGAFVPTMIAAPLVGPWLVMAFMRYAQVPHRKVALPIFTGMILISTAITAICFLAPELMK